MRGMWRLIKLEPYFHHHFHHNCRLISACFVVIEEKYLWTNRGRFLERTVFIGADFLLKTHWLDVYGDNITMKVLWSPLKQLRTVLATRLTLQFSVNWKLFQVHLGYHHHIIYYQPWTLLMISGDVNSQGVQNVQRNY